MPLEFVDKQDTAAVMTALSRDGACVIPEYLSDSACDHLMGDFRPHLDGFDWGIDELGYRDDFYGTRTKRLHGLFSKSAHMADVLTHPLMMDVTRRAFVETELAREVRLSNTELMVLGQGQGNQDFHTDGVSWRRAQQSEENEILISVNIALTPFRKSNGATRVVPGSHLWPSGRAPRDDEIEFAEMPRGAALMYTGNVVHSGGSNDENEARVGLYLGYIVSWLRPIENQLVTNDPADVFALPDAAQQLLDVSKGGFTVYA